MSPQMEPLSGLGLRKKEQKPELNQTFPTLVSGVQGVAGFGLTISFDDVVMAKAIVAMVVLVGVAVGWQQLGMMGRCGGGW